MKGCPRQQARRDDSPGQTPSRRTRGDPFGRRASGYPSGMRRRLLFAVVLPVGAWLLSRAANAIAARYGESGITRLMRAPHQRRQARA